MRGYEVIFKFPMISFKIPLTSQFSWDPLHYFPYSSSPTLRIPHVFGIHGKVFSSHILVWQFHSARTIFHGTWPLTHIVNIPVFYLRLSLSVPLPLPRIKSYSSYSSVLGVFGVILRQNSKVY